ncbi:MAG: hypothetical protein F9K18_04420 [Thermoanaerobaculia bacterium]|nr:MAG: hypothetical protein F9K18_04420 [Thermoanaerobaculia bacterium]
MSPGPALRSTALFLFVLALLAGAAPALAYLDPAAGSLILQVLLGGIAGLALVIKLFWRRLLGLLGLDRKKQDAAPR